VTVSDHSSESSGSEHDIGARYSRLARTSADHAGL